LLRVRAALFLLIAVACGGQIATYGDGGTAGDGSTVPKGDGSTTPPVYVDAMTPVFCGPHSESGSSGPNGQCSMQEDYSCGADTYSVQCDCPQAACACIKNGASVTKVPFPVCPACGSMSSPPSLLCGFPQ
jgi:hypothetical protein